MREKIACIVLNYNDYSTTSILINKIKSYKALDHIIIVDNCSTDNSFEKLKSFQDEKIIVMSSGKNGGYGFGNNFGLKYAINELKCKYCIIANPDVIFEEDIISRLVMFLENNNDFAVVAPFQVGTKKQAWKKVGVFKDQLFNSLLLNKIFNPRYYPDSYFNNAICEVYAVKGCFLVFRAEAIQKIGFYDEDFFLFEEEKVIAYKLEQCNYKSAVLTDVNYVHNHSVSIKKTFNKFGQSKKLVLKSNELYLKKYMGVGRIRMAIIKTYHFFCFCESVLYDLFLSITH